MRAELDIARCGRRFAMIQRPLGAADVDRAVAGPLTLDWTEQLRAAGRAVRCIIRRHAVLEQDLGALLSAALFLSASRRHQTPEPLRWRCGATTSARDIANSLVTERCAAASRASTQWGRSLSR